MLKDFQAVKGQKAEAKRALDEARQNLHLAIMDIY